jgi:hypothetical protein
VPESVSALSQYVSGTSGHAFDLYLFTAMFVAEMDDTLYTALGIAILTTAIEMYNHAAREILIVFAAFTSNE